MEEEFFKNILRMVIRKALEIESAQTRRKYGPILKALKLDPDKTEIAVLELCIEAAQERIAKLTNRPAGEPEEE